MKIGLAQLNPTVGDFAGNRRLVEQAAEEALADGAELVIFPELVLTGYPPLDLLSRPGFIKEQEHQIEALLPLSQKVPILIGAVTQADAANQQEKSLLNTALLLCDGKRAGYQAKSLLPSYDVFDEKRHFEPAHSWKPVPWKDGGPAMGLSICEDVWTHALSYPFDPVEAQVQAGAEIILNLSASPWHMGKPAARREMVADLAKHHGVPIVMVNQVGGNDELIFDGGSFVVDAQGRVIASLPLFESAVAVVDLASGGTPPVIEEPADIAQLESALVLGIKDYFNKQGLPPRAVLGLSGGIDSAVTAHLAVKALGAERVLGLLMPSCFSSEHSVSDALELARNLGVETRTVAIKPVFDAYLASFKDLFGEQEDYGLAQQNIQSRIRGALVMGVANYEGRLALATGNKSELSMGYCTLYGDMIGGLAVLGDVFKDEVYALARHANATSLARGKGELIPASSIEKPPSAELAPDQQDSDELPPYEILDSILRQSVIEGKTEQDIVPPPGTSPEVVQSILTRLDRNEFKRRQGPISLRVSEKAFGIGRRIPIVQRYR